jgi:uncharacterized protein with HEPN domain
MEGKISSLERARHIFEAINYIGEFTKGIDFEGFKDNVLVRSAIERQLMIVGEASVHISEEIKNQYPQIPWYQIKGFRNFIVHEYFGVSYQMEWSVIVAQLPNLKSVIKQIINQLETK